VLVSDVLANLLQQRLTGRQAAVKNGARQGRNGRQMGRHTGMLADKVLLPARKPNTAACRNRWS
jgi:hypothetical protein